MAVNPPLEVASAGRDLPDDALVRIENLIRKKFGGRKLNNGMKGTDTVFQDVLLEDHHVIRAIEYFGGELPQSFFKHFERVKTNVTKKSASDFVNKLREAVNGSDHKLWAEFEQPPRSSMYLRTFEVKGPKTSDLEKT